MSVIDIGAARRRTRPAAANSVRLTAAPAHGSTATDFSKSIMGTKSNLEYLFNLEHILLWDPTSIMGPKSIFRLGSTSLMGTHPNFSDKPMRAPDLPALGVSSELSSDNRVFQMEGHQETAKYETTYSLHANDHKSRK